MSTVMLVLAVLFVRGAFGPPNSSRPVVVTGVTQWGALARQVMGPDMRVVSLLSDPNADPHEHDATISDAANVSSAAYVIVNGAGYDTWLEQLVRLQGPQAHVVNVAKLMGVHSGSNPHLFYDPRAAVAMVTALSSSVEHHGRHPDVARRAKALVAQLRVVQAHVSAIRSSCSNVPVAATEDVATYLLHDAGLRIVTPESFRLAVGNGVDPSIQDLATAQAQLRARPAFLVDNSQTATPLTNQLVELAASLHVPVVRVTETMTGTSYPVWISGVLDRIERALRLEGCLR